MEEKLELERGSGNVFADLGLKDAPELKLKATIVGQINSIIRNRHLSQTEAAKILGVPQPKISALQNGKLRGFSLEKLLEFMTKLDREVEIGFKKTRSKSKPRYVVTNEGKRTPVLA
ncbi:helix-turn-helix domain-containing protein [Ruegeria atlantica]|uniref:helix-turn-helix domain-containing protein n=1 Tax=Ruegeria atlantica TaxID=81569 RepID=UPI002493DB71|nr:helix-turn-helix transcriptional regulator [Ruegeria atlantica]